MRFFFAVILMCAATGAIAQHGSLGVDPSNAGVHTSSAQTGPIVLGDPAWVFPASDPLVDGPVVFAAEAGPVVMGDLVYAMGVQPPRVWAIDRSVGVARWWAEVPASVLDSWSSPTADAGTNAVYVASGAPGFFAAGEVRAFEARTGGALWSTPLLRDVVNASPTVTRDLGPRDRLFITDYEGFYAGGEGGSVYAINVDARTPGVNPFDPGAVVWRAPLFAAMTGATPAYAHGRVVVATAGDGLSRNGRVVCFDAASDTPETLWDTEVVGGDAFFGGVSIADGFVYAATYNFSGARRSGRLVKIDLMTGDIVWTTPANRTSSVPIALGDGRVLLSTGLFGFGSLPALQMFEDIGDSAAFAWDSVDATWVDDGDGLIGPGEYGVFGGWAQQPAVVLGAAGYSSGLAYAGSLGDTGGLFAGYGELRVLDLSRTPDDGGFIVDVFAGAGSSPAVSGGMVFTVGAAGVFAFGDSGGSRCVCARCEPWRVIEPARRGGVSTTVVRRMMDAPCVRGAEGVR